MMSLPSLSRPHCPGLSRMFALPVLALIVLLAAGMPYRLAIAQSAPEEPDTLVLSDTLTYDDIRRESVFTGNVIMTRGTMTLRAEKLVMHEDDNGFQHGTATAEGGLVYIRQENAEKFEVIEARGLRGEYNGELDTTTVIGQAVVTRFVCGKPFDTIKGERVVYDQKTETYHAYGGPQSAAAGGRVRSVAQPRARSEAAVATCRKQQGGS